MLDDIYQDYCKTRHYGPVLREEDGFLVMRCSFCETIYKTPCLSKNKEENKKSSKSCIQACDWFTEDQTVKCKSCGYTGPRP